MQVKLETAEGLERRLHVTVPAEEYESAVDTRLKSLGKRVRVDGFRPGKVPLKVLKQRFGGQARQDALSDLLEKTYPQALTQTEVQPAGQPKIEFEQITPGEDFSYVAVFDVYPEIELKGVEGMKIEAPDTEIVDADVDNLIARLREQRKVFEDKGGAAAEGDKLVIDFAGTIDGEPFDGGQGSDVEVELGAGRFLKEMEDGLAGMSAGDSADLPVKFPDDYHAEALQAKQASFAVTVKSVQASRLPDIDDDFCASLGVSEGGEPALREKLRTSLERERDQAVTRLKKNQVMEKLLEANPIDVPSGLVAQEIERMRHEAGQRFGQQAQLSHEDLHKMLPDDLFAEQAKRRTALGLLLSELVKAKDIKAEPADVEARLAEMAGEFDEPDKAMAYYRSNAEFMQNLGAMVVEERVVESCLAAAKIKSVKLSFDELSAKAGE